MTDKKTLRQIKRIDLFQERFFASVQWVNSHARQIVWGTLPVLVLATAGISWNFYNKVQIEKRQDEVSLIDEDFSKEETSSSEKRNVILGDLEQLEKKKEAGKEAGKDKESAKPEDPALVASIAQKRKELALVKPDHSKTLARYLAFYEKSPSTLEGWRSALSATRILAEENKLEDAVKLLEKILPQASKSDLGFYNTQVRLFYIALLEGAEHYDKALGELEGLLKTQDSENKPKLLLIQGRLLALLGRKDESNKTFETILSEHNSSPEARKARAYLAL
ncbi:MAG: hypothetical protein KA436_09670 [Oligoflexales bacterium]|nr:hypothetical protein [Oligoflexales bacterium]